MPLPVSVRMLHVRFLDEILCLHRAVAYVPIGVPEIIMLNRDLANCIGLCVMLCYFTYVI